MNQWVAGSNPALCNNNQFLNSTADTMPLRSNAMNFLSRVRFRYGFSGAPKGLC